MLTRPDPERGPEKGSEKREIVDPLSKADFDPRASSRIAVENAILEKIVDCKILEGIQADLKKWPGAPESWNPREGQSLMVGDTVQKIKICTGGISATLGQHDSERLRDRIVNGAQAQILSRFETALDNLVAYGRTDKPIKELSLKRIGEVAVDFEPTKVDALSEVLTSCWLVNSVLQGAAKNPELFKAVIDKMGEKLQTQEKIPGFSADNKFHFHPCVLGEAVYGLTLAAYASSTLPVKERWTVKADLRRALVMYGLNERLAENVLEEYENGGNKRKK